MSGEGITLAILYKYWRHTMQPLSIATIICVICNLLGFVGVQVLVGLNLFQAYEMSGMLDGYIVSVLLYGIGHCGLVVVGSRWFRHYEQLATTCMMTGRTVQHGSVGYQFIT